MTNGVAVPPRSSSSVSVSDIGSSSSRKATPSSPSSPDLTVFQSFTTSPPALASSSSATKPSHQTGVMVGAAIGGAAVLGLIIGLTVLIGMRRFKHKSRSSKTLQATWRDDRDQDRGINGTSRELAIVGPTPELEDSEESYKPVSELENSEESQRPVLELESLARIQRE